MPEEQVENHLGRWALENLSKNPDNDMQFDGRNGKAVTRKVTREKAIRVARAMQIHGLKTGDIATVCLSNTNDTCLPLIASFCIGVAVNPLDPKMSKVEMDYLVSLMTPRIIFCDANLADFFLGVIEKHGITCDIVIFGETDDTKFLRIRDFYSPFIITDGFQVVDFDPKNTTAYILCSSGSTGLPKGVCHTHEQSAKTVRGITPLFNNLLMCQFSSLYWISGFAMTLLNICINTVKINAVTFSVDAFFEHCEKYKPEMFVTTPTALRAIIKHPKYKDVDLSHVKQFMLSGAAVDFDELDALQVKITNGRVFNSYGMTEIGGPVTYSLEPKIHDASVGKIIPFIKYKILDLVTGEIITEPNRKGELYLKSESMMKSYFRNPEATKMAFDEDGWLKTNDLVKIDENGKLFILDRMKDVYKCSGYNVSPTGVELIINTHPAIMDSAVIGVKHKELGQVGLGFIKRRPGRNITAQEVKDYVKEKLEFYCELRGGVVFVDDFELTPSGKIKKNVLLEILKTANIE